MISRTALVKVVPRIEPFIDLYIEGMAREEINTPLRAAHFLGQVTHESGMFTATRETLNYSTERLTARKENGQRVLFGDHRITDAQARMYGRNIDHPANQKILANILYGGEWGRKNLGNILPNDGWDFRGGGHKQLTGRNNYTRFSKDYYGDERLVKNPSLIDTPEVAVASALWFWSENDLNRIADTGSVEAVTKKVNGGSIGLAERKHWTQKFLRALS